MSTFGKKMEKSGASIGNRKIDSDEALGVNFKALNNIMVAEIKLDALVENPYQPRTSMNDEELNELKDSIEQRGLLQPILVCPLPSNPKLFQIIAGHRRTSAMKLLGKTSIPALIVKDQSKDLRIDALIENIQRVDLSSIDEAFAVKEIIESSEIKQQDVAKMLGKSKNYISRLLKITSISPEIIKKFKEGKILSSSILSEISYVEDISLQEQIFDKVYKDGLNREKTRKLIATFQLPKERVTQKKETFFYHRSKKNISFKLDLTSIEGKKKAINELETLLLELKNSI